MRLLFLTFLFFLAIECTSGQKENSGNEKILVFSHSILLPGVEGRIDHMAYNSKAGLLYVAALGNNTVEVVDLKLKKVIHTIRGLKEPQGLIYIPDRNAIFVANGDNGECDIFDADTYRPLYSVELGSDADNVRMDPSSGNIFVGYGDGGIAIIDSKTFKQLSNIRLKGHPESFQLDSKLKKLYVNVPDEGLLEKIDLMTNIISERWSMDVASANFPMALDEDSHRLYVGCRRPSKLLVIDCETGKGLASVDISADTDDIFYDRTSGLVFASCGAGFIDVIRQTGTDHYEVISKIATRSGARTSLYLPELKQLLVAAPARSGDAAQIMVYH